VRSRERHTKSFFVIANSEVFAQSSDGSGMDRFQKEVEKRDQGSARREFQKTDGRDCSCVDPGGGPGRQLCLFRTIESDGEHSFRGRYEFNRPRVLFRGPNVTPCRVEFVDGCAIISGFLPLKLSA
jgi:hypothetical protein